VLWFYEDYFVRRANCLTKGEIYEAEGYLYQCRTADRNGRTVYELWLGIERPLGGLPSPGAKPMAARPGLACATTASPADCGSRSGGALVLHPRFGRVMVPAGCGGGSGFARHRRTPRTATKQALTLREDQRSRMAC
jgi:hypothetical protein